MQQAFHRESVFEKIIKWLVLASIFIPYVSFGLNQFDTQPWYMLLCAVYILINYRNYSYLPRVVWFAAMLPVGAMIIALFTDASTEEEIRAIGSYVGFALAFTAICLVRIRQRSLYFFMVLVLSLWMFAGLVQLAMGSYIFEPLITVRTSDGRGVTGLANEPSTYALVLIILYGSFIFEARAVHNLSGFVFGLLVVAFVILVAKSTMGALLLPFLAALIATRFNLGPKTLFALVVSSIVGVVLLYLISTYSAGSRLALLLPSLLESPMAVIADDVSTSTRIGHIFISIYLHLTNWAIPQGFGSFAEQAYLAGFELRSFIQIDFGNKIMSGVGATLYELGILGYCFIYLVYACCRGQHSQSNKPRILIRFFSTLAIFSTAIPISTPLIPAFLALLYFSS